jgi:trigger factor
MTVTVEVRPRIEPLAYDGFTVKEVSVEVADEEVEALLQTVAEERAVYEPVDGDLQQGDLAIIDYTVPESGDSAKDVVFKVGSGHFPNEFFETLLGKKRDDECDVEASFPEDSPTPFAGKRQRFSVKIKEIKRRNIPVVNDDFAKDLQFEHLEDLKAKLRERVITAKKRDVEATQQSELIEKLIATHSFDAPEALVNQEIGAAIAQIRAMSKDERSDEILKEDIRPKAERNVKAAILLELIGEKEGISISDEEIKEEILSMAQRVNFSPEDIIKYHIARDGSLDRLKQSFLEKKVLQFLLSRTTVEKGA